MKRIAIAFAAAVVAIAALPAGALAGGRLIETGHDADWECAVAGRQCHFIQAAVRYVRNGAPDPSKKVLLIDDAGLQMRAAIVAAFGPDIASQLDVVDPKSPAFAGATLSPSVYSAIVVASDQTCGNDAGGFSRSPANDPNQYCDLNRPVGNWPPPQIGVPTLTDSPSIAARSADIKAFFDAGGGIFVGSGADNGDGHTGDLYYAFIDVPGGAAGSACQAGGGVCLGGAGALALTPEGRAIGFTDGTNGTPNDITCGLNGMGCATHNSFKAPRVGSQLLIAESGPMAFVSTLFEDANPPDTIITGGPGAPLAVAAPAPPIPVLGTGNAGIAFRASEDTTTFGCSLDGGAVTSCSSPVTFTGLAAGVHKVTISATDAAHNVDATPAELSWLVAADADHDRYLASNPFGPADCNDANGAIHPGAAEIVGNRVDENCDGVIAPFPRLRPTAAYRFVGGSCARCIRFTRLQVTAVPAGAAVKIRCSGPGCRFTRTAKPAHGGRVDLLRYVRRRQLRPGTTVQVAVTRPNTIGSVKQLVVALHKGKVDVHVRNLCQSPGARRPARTCAGIR